MKKIILFFLLISIFIESKAQINFCFTPPTHFACNTPTELCYGDFNLDGKMDIAAISTASISVVLGNGNGGFGSPITSATTGSYRTSICCADFNNDNKLDIAFANASLNSASILLGNGNGTFGAQSNFATGTFPRKLVYADFNNDGELDLATANANSTNISILLGNGNGIFGNANNIPTGTGSNGYWCLVNADFNTDGNQDLIYGANGSFYILFGTGTGSFGTGSIIPNSSGEGAITDDFNGDGKLDLATTNGGQSKIFIMLGDGLGSFAASYNFNVSSGVSQLLSADLNGDNKKDLIANFAFIYSGNGNGSFNFSNYTGAVNISNLIACDLNGDGKLDLAGCYNFGGISDIAIYLNGFEPSINILSQTNASCGLSNDGTISIDVPTGNQPFNYYWSNGNQSPNLNGLSPGNYSIYVIDDKGCISDTSTITIGINQGANYNYNVTNMTVEFSMIDPTNCTNGGFLWDYGNGMTSTIAQTPSVTYNNPGVYTACLKCNNAPSVCIVCANITVPGNYTGTTSTVGIEEQTNEKQFIIYPNPFTLTTTLNFSEQQTNTTIKITDILGNEIKTINFTGKQFLIDRAEMKSGIYFVQTTDEKKHISNKKIILQ